MTAENNKRKWVYGSIGVIIASICCVLVLALITLQFISARNRVENPRVQIRLPANGARLPARESQNILLQVSNLESVARYELWVDGILFANEVAPQGSTGLPATGRLFWIPWKAGIYTLIGRAYDAQGRAGISAPVVIEAVPGAEIGPVEGIPPETLIPPGQGEEPAQPVPLEPTIPFEAGEGAPPTAPPTLEVSHTGACNVHLRWTDSSQDESGFRIYRMNAAREPFRLIGEVQANQVEYDDVVVRGGQYQYFVSTLGENGESPGPFAAVVVPREACFSENARLQFEATALYTNDQFEGTYCYLSLAELQPARLPESDDLDFMQQGGSWNIDKHASGYRRFIFVHQDPTTPVPVAVECWGHQGHQSYFLGAHRASHPYSEWDGRDLVGEAENFRITYHIEPFDLEFGLNEIGVDPGIPAPRNLRISENVIDCLLHINYSEGNKSIPIERELNQWGCLEISEQMLVWDWSPSEVTTLNTIDGFRIYVWDVTNGEENMQLVFQQEVGSVVQASVVPFPPSGQIYQYEVEAFISEERGGRLGPRTSQRSEPKICDGPQC